MNNRVKGMALAGGNGTARLLMGLSCMLAWMTAANGQYHPLNDPHNAVRISQLTPLGGSGGESGQGVATDGSGNVYVCGTTSSDGWISGGWISQLPRTSALCGFVMKLNPAGDPLWSTYIDAEPTAVAVDTEGNVYTVGGANNATTTFEGGWNTTYGGEEDAFLVKLTPTGQHAWSTYIGGEHRDEAADVTVDNSGNVIVSGFTHSAGWVSGGWNTTLNAGSTSVDNCDGFVVKFDAAGEHQWSSYIGGLGVESCADVATHNGNVFLTGGTYATDTQSWVSGGWRTAYNGGDMDGFAVKLNAAGEHQWSTFIGGAYLDKANAITADYYGKAYITGETGSAGWVSGGGDTEWGGSSQGGANGGNSDAFVLKLTASGEHVWSTYVGGYIGADQGSGIAVDADTNVCLSGTTDYYDQQQGNSGITEAFVTKLNSVGTMAWSVVMGGSDNEFCWHLALAPSGSIYVVGQMFSTDWVSDAWTGPMHGAPDGFLARLEPLIPAAPTQPGALNIGPDRITWTWRDNSNNEEGFQVWADAGSSRPSTLRTLTRRNAVSWLQSGLATNAMYTFMVAAMNYNGMSKTTDPYTAWTAARIPLAPLVDEPTVSSFMVAIADGDGNPEGTEYAIKNLIANNWVQADGSGAQTPMFRTKTDWGRTKVNNLETNTTYGFAAMARNGALVETALSAATQATTLNITKVPNLVGLTRSEAQKSLSNVGLSVGQVSEECNSAVPAGTVISQSPPAGTDVVSSNPVNMIVSTGKCLQPMPSLLGLNGESAQVALHDAGLGPVTVTEECSTSVPTGQVMGQSPLPGDMIYPGTPITLLVSTGPCGVTVPNVTGMEKSAAQDALVAALLWASPITEEYDETVPKGVVASQNPAAGTQLPRGSNVALIISRGPAPAEGEPSMEGEGEPPAEGETPAEGEMEPVSLDDIAKGLLDNFAALDTNDDGVLSFTEAKAYYPTLTAEQWSTLDEDGNSVVCVAELNNYLDGGPSGCQGCKGGGSGAKSLMNLGMMLLGSLSLALLVPRR